MFDWSSLTRNEIVLHLMQLVPRLCNQTIGTDQFHSILTRYIKKHWPVTVTQEWNIKVKKYGTFVGGTYYSYKDENDKKCIEVVLHYNPIFDEIKITTRRFLGICKNIADTILHEVIHMRQYRRRAFKELPDYASTASSSKIREEQSYLGCSDEIDAYGFNIACELMDKFKGKQTDIVQYLDSNLKGKPVAGCCWRMYLKAFGHDQNHEIIKRVKKKVIQYLPRADEGRPFKSKDWICH